MSFPVMKIYKGPYSAVQCRDGKTWACLREGEIIPEEGSQNQILVEIMVDHINFGYKNGYFDGMDSISASMDNEIQKRKAKW